MLTPRSKSFTVASSGAIQTLVEGSGGSVKGSIPGLTLASVPIDSLVALESSQEIDSIRVPLRVDIPLAANTNTAKPALKEALGIPPALTGEEVGKTNADDWQAAGINGTGVKVGIVDLFDQNVWNAAQAAGEVPVAAGSFCQVNGVPCNAFTITPGQRTAVAVAEVIHEMAPGAQIYVALANTITTCRQL